MSTSLGLIETVGLVAAITAADAASKSADVKIIDYELTRGKGLVTVKFEGDVSAVEAALHAAVAAVEKLGEVYSKRVIPRPSDQLEKIVYKKEIIDKMELGNGQKENTDTNIDRVIDTDTKIDEEVSVDSTKEKVESEVVVDNSEDKEQTELDDQRQSETEETDDVCNLCHDPACPRRKGDLRTMCMHHKE